LLQEIRGRKGKYAGELPPVYGLIWSINNNKRMEKIARRSGDVRKATRKRDGTRFSEPGINVELWRREPSEESALTRGR